jgi:hypothetical protein
MSGKFEAEKGQKYFTIRKCGLQTKFMANAILWGFASLGNDIIMKSVIILSPKSHKVSASKTRRNRCFL